MHDVSQNYLMKQTTIYTAMRALVLLLVVVLLVHAVVFIFILLVVAVVVVSSWVVAVRPPPVPLFFASPPLLSPNHRRYLSFGPFLPHKHSDTVLTNAADAPASSFRPPIYLSFAGRGQDLCTRLRFPDEHRRLAHPLQVLIHPRLFDDENVNRSSADIRRALKPAPARLALG